MTVGAVDAIVVFSLAGGVGFAGTLTAPEPVVGCAPGIGACGTSAAGAVVGGCCCASIRIGVAASANADAAKINRRANFLLFRFALSTIHFHSDLMFREIP